ncbi:unnamed protein product [Chilo suppressalis]|uniref:BESS domain-containing protein n=1 Tax=Chilo suppressalis TaxID=168631 RepID=A0ABN8B7Z1_CHISP|nr:unnamed protein product [Chilo suppressalis]
MSTNIRTPSHKKVAKSQSNNDDYEQKLLNFLTTTQMIVPMLRKLNDDQNHFAKIEIMNILQKAKSFYPFEQQIHGQVYGPRMSFTPTPTPSPQSYYTHSPSPTMPEQSPVSTPAPATSSITKKPQIIREQIIATGQQNRGQFVTGPAKQMIYLPLNTSTPSTSQSPMNSIRELDHPELLQYIDLNKHEPSAANYLSQFQEQ